MADVSKQPLAESLGTVVGRLDERVREGDIEGLCLFLRASLSWIWLSGAACVGGNWCC